MTPDQLAKSGSEHGEQRALFAWCNIAERYGWRVADNNDTYSGKVDLTNIEPMPLLHWFHAIHNQRDGNNALAGAKAKAEGVKAGVADLFLPIPAYYNGTQYFGFYIEMKRKTGSIKDLSAEQREFVMHCINHNYKFDVAFGWRYARQLLLEYLGVLSQPG